jgi:hypothetical protein
MAFSTTSFFAGVGTVFAALVVGFAGGTMMTGSAKMEPNRVERVAARTASTAPVAKPDTAEVPSSSAAKVDAPTAASEGGTPETTAAPDRVISTTTPSASEQTSPVQPPPVMVNDANDDHPSPDDSAKKARDSELRKQAESRRAERRAERRERRRHQDIEDAENAVRQMQMQMQRDGRVQDFSDRDEAPRRFGLFGND